VLLTLGSGKMSKAIALFSGGEFSHSALCTSPYMIFESDGETEIGHKVLKTVGYLHGRSKLEQYGKIPGDPVRGAVYRHPEMVSISPQQFEEALKKAMLESFGKTYSKMARLARLAKASTAVQWAVDLYCKFDDWRLSKDAIPDAFCSELVARFYKRLGLPLFSEGKSPEDVSPNDLSRSNLKPVSDIVFGTADVKSLAAPLDDANALLKAYETHDPFAARQHSALLISRSVAELQQLGEQMRSQTHNMLGSVINGVLATLLTIQEHLEECALLGHRGCIRRGTNLATRWSGLVAALPTIVSCVDEAPGKVPSMLRQVGLAHDSFLRCVVLLQSQRLKAQSFRATGRWRRQIRRGRHKILREGRSTLALHAKMGRWVGSL